MHPDEAIKFAQEFRGLMYEMPFQVPENMILLGRCIGILSGICTGLYPEFNMWTNLAPYAQKLVQNEGGTTFQTILKEVVSTLQILVSLPRKTESLLSRIEQGKLETRDPELHYRIRRVERSQNQLIRAILFAAFFLGGIQVYLAGQILVAGGLGILALLAIISLVFTR